MFKTLIYRVTLVLLVGLVSNVSAGLLAHWEFDESSGTTARDSSGHGHDGTLRGDPQWAAGIIGSGALSLDGTDGLVEVPHGTSLNLTDALTITAWVKLHNLSTYFFIVCKQPSGTARDNYPGNYEFRTEANTGALQFGHQQTQGEQYTFYTSGTRIIAEQWYHVAVAFTKAGQVEFYVDGAAAGSSAQSTNFGVLNNEPVRIGGRKDGYSFFNGLLDDIRVYDRALSAAQIQKLYDGIPPTFTIAEKPDPADGAMHADTWVTLAWKPGESAVSHDVYLGDNFDDVNNGVSETFRGNQIATYYVAGFPGFAYPDGLVPGTTYYWRIDEVNNLRPDSPWKGDIWSFSIPPKKAYNPNPADGAEFVGPDNVTLSWTAGFGAKLHYVYFGDDFDDVNMAKGGLPQGATTYKPSSLESEKVYYWRVDEFDAANTYKGDLWSFTTPGAVGNPQPSNDAADAEINAVLTWTPADHAASHQVYFGTAKEVVRKADTTSPEYKGSKALGAESYDPGVLEPQTTYYWRVDEVNDLHPSSPWKGPLWSFTTGDFILIDDFESYDAGNNEIWWSWKDGLGYAAHGNAPAYPGNGTGSAVGDETTAPFTEETIVHGGRQSMPFVYDNNKDGYAKYSEVEKTLSTSRDWTVKGVDTLSLWFRGNSDNAAERLYVAVANRTGTAAVVYHDDGKAAQKGRWTQWVIPLQKFADQGVNLTDVDKIAIGLGTKGNMTAPGGSGKMYIDDIRLNR